MLPVVTVAALAVAIVLAVVFSSDNPLAFLLAVVGVAFLAPLTIVVVALEFVLSEFGGAVPVLGDWGTTFSWFAGGAYGFPGWLYLVAGIVLWFVTVSQLTKDQEEDTDDSASRGNLESPTQDHSAAKDDDGSAGNESASVLDGPSRGDLMVEQAAANAAGFGTATSDDNVETTTSDDERVGATVSGGSSDKSEEDSAGGSGNLKTLPSVGPKRAAKLSEAGFESVADVRRASKEELAEVIGSALAAQIKVALRSDDTAASSTNEPTERSETGETTRSAGKSGSDRNDQQSAKSQGTIAKQLDEVNGIGEAKIETLRNEGYSTVEDLRIASSSELAAVVGHRATAVIRREFGYADTEPESNRPIDMDGEAGDGNREKSADELRVDDEAGDDDGEADDMVAGVDDGDGNANEEISDTVAESSSSDESQAADDGVDRSPTRKELIKALRRLDDSTHGYPKATDVGARHPYEVDDYYDAFDSWGEALAAADIDKEARLIEEIDRVAERVDGRPTTADMDEYSPHSSGTFSRVFGGWDNALAAAGLDEAEAATFDPAGLDSSSDADAREEPDRADLLAELRRLDEGWSDVDRLLVYSVSKYHPDDFDATFGSLDDALEAARARDVADSGGGDEEAASGSSAKDAVEDSSPEDTDQGSPTEDAVDTAERSDSGNSSRGRGAGVTFSKADVLREMRHLADEIGHIPNTTEFQECARMSLTPVYRYFDGWDDAVAAAGLADDQSAGPPSSATTNPGGSEPEPPASRRDDAALTDDEPTVDSSTADGSPVDDSDEGEPESDILKSIMDDFDIDTDI